ncbi:MAG: hypothetical protein E6Q97_00085 [Desulfurellales bacterium]|nr:MAG: hypothetical protein E6Q97_00085 [Desulfurellales bacterium]
MKKIAAIICLLALGAVASVMARLVSRPKRTDLRSITEWENHYGIEVVGLEGFRVRGKVIIEPMTSEEFIRRARASTCRVGIGGLHNFGRGTGRP